jgi:hypothetical protein
MPRSSPPVYSCDHFISLLGEIGDGMFLTVTASVYTDVTVAYTELPALLTSEREALKKAVSANYLEDRGFRKAVTVKSSTNAVAQYS